MGCWSSRKATSGRSTSSIACAPTGRIARAPAWPDPAAAAGCEGAAAEERCQPGAGHFLTDQCRPVRTCSGTIGKLSRASSGPSSRSVTYRTASRSVVVMIRPGPFARTSATRSSRASHQSVRDGIVDHLPVPTSASRPAGLRNQYVARRPSARRVTSPAASNTGITLG